MTSRVFGRLADGRPVHAHSVGDGPELVVLEWGARVHALTIGGGGRRRNVALGHPDLATYLRSPHFLGATIGRFANRIAGGRFVVDGVEHVLPRNEGPHNLHSGPDGFDRQPWRTTVVAASYVEMEHTSPAGHQGFPGTVEAKVRFAVGDGEVRIQYAATTDAPTPLSLTNHTYFNLDGEATGTVEQHLLQVHAEAYTPVDDTSIPTGELRDVESTPFDWRTPTRIGDRLPALEALGGLDHNFVVRGTGLRPAVALTSGDGSLRLTVLTDRPGTQVYAGDKLDGTLVGTSGTAYDRGAGIALETQAFPDSPNQPAFGSAVLRPGETWSSTTVWRFDRP